MNRRATLRVLGAAIGSLAGCTASNVRPPVANQPAPGNPDPIVGAGFPTTVCNAPANPDIGSKAIVTPAAGPNWDGLTVDERYRLRGEGEAKLTDETFVIGVERNGTARAYPVSILWWHQIVNDTLDGDPLIVTYCPLCQTGMVARRIVSGNPTTFRNTGQFWRPPDLYVGASLQEGRAFAASPYVDDAEVIFDGNLVLMDDLTGSYWSQVLARGICGRRAGTRLWTLTPDVMTWGEWRTANTNTDVLLPPPLSRTG
ncbi:DUF3179 domain-containing (seleno)protein [Haloferax namakaokahaiae]|uniref:DUF3179 domain-containing (Seleno)protein n=1 Tax=Haloferax namakaokahaiae TaxID=1748331 RepID=A0ABD5ZBV3_9EURY